MKKKKFNFGWFDLFVNLFVFRRENKENTYAAKIHLKEME